MKHLFCDICKKEVMDPIINDVTYFHIREFDLCEDCHDDLDMAIKQTVRAKQPFDYEWYDKLRIDLIQEGIKKNKITIPR